MKILVDYDEVAELMHSSRSSLRTLRLMKKFPKPCFTGSDRTIYWDLNDILNIRLKQNPPNWYEYPDVFEILIKYLDFLLEWSKKQNQDLIDIHVQLKQKQRESFEKRFLEEKTNELH